MLITITHDGKIFSGVDPESEDGKALLSRYGVPQSVINAAMSDAVLNEVQKQRKAAYILESDPLYMEWQYDQTPESEKAWRDKVTEIKNRYPLPSVS